MHQATGMLSALVAELKTRISLGEVVWESADAAMHAPDDDGSRMLLVSPECRTEYVVEGVSWRELR